MARSNRWATRLVAADALSGVTNSAAVILLALAMIAASVIVWAALMVRKLLIIVAAVFAPVAFAGSLADITSAWVRRWIETMVALVVSKLILVIIFVVGLGVLVDGVGQSRQPGAAATAAQTLTQTVTGVLILVMAGFAPWLAIKLVHFAGDSFHTIHAHAGSVAVGPQRAVRRPPEVECPGRPAAQARVHSGRSRCRRNRCGCGREREPAVSWEPPGQRCGRRGGRVRRTGGRRRRRGRGRHQSRRRVRQPRHRQRLLEDRACRPAARRDRRNVDQDDPAIRNARHRPPPTAGRSPPVMTPRPRKGSNVRDG